MGSTSQTRNTPSRDLRQVRQEDEDDGSHSTVSFQRDDDDVSQTFQSHTHIPRAVAESEKNKKSSCKSNCINGNLVALKALLFIFYGGVGVICTWLNHTQVSSRFSEKETLLVYGISSLLSLATPIIFGLCSDKSARPKKTLVICLLLGGLLYPLILFVPPAVPYRFRDRLTWCDDGSSASSVTKGESSIFTSRDVYAPSRAKLAASCLPNRINCTSSMAELVTNVVGGCSEGCGGKLIISKCSYECNDLLLSEAAAARSRNRASPSPPTSTTEEPNYELIDNLVAEAQISPTEYEDLLEDGEEFSFRPDAPPHVCVDDNADFKYKSLCFAFDQDMHEITLHASELSGYADQDGKCRYPLVGYSETKREFHHLLSCSPLSAHCHVSCDLRWDSHESDQWACQSDYVQWIISFAAFVAVHSLGTMLLISAAGLLNSAILSMAHEHSGFFGCQYSYAAMGFGILSPAVTFLFQLIESVDIPWNLHYVVAYAIWFLVCALLALCLPYHAEWVPKPGSVRPMICRWTLRGHTSLFFVIIVLLGALQCLMDVLAFHQIASVGASLLLIALGASALVGPALIFVCRVEKVIDYCGHHHLFSIALVVFSLQFTGYAYLTGSEAEWSILLRAMDTFSVLMVWITASYTTYASAPRSLAATCQTVIVTLYCALGRGLGGIIGYVGLTFLSKDLLLKILSLVSVFICVLYLMIHYWCLKSSPYTRQYDFDKPATYGSSGKYTPLKLMNGRRKSKNVAQSEDFDAKDLKDPIDDL